MDSHQATSDDRIQCSYESKRQKINDDRTPPATSNITLPPAPTLEDYLTNDGHLRYCPRPEWVRPIPSSTIADTNTDYYARPSSPHPSQSTAVEMGSDILDVRLRYYREVRNNHVLGVPLEDRELHPRIIDHNHERIEAMNDGDERRMDRLDGNDTVFGEEEVVEQRAILSSIMRRCDFHPSGDEIQGPLHQPVGEEEQDSNDVVYKTRVSFDCVTMKTISLQNGTYHWLIRNCITVCSLWTRPRFGSAFSNQTWRYRSCTSFDSEQSKC